MVNNWTDSQRQAITVDGGPVIVTAAAGAGKTTVLVERVISRITDKDNPVDIDRILIVTYTRAAAKELKERFSMRLRDLIAQNPFDKNLLRQQMLLQKAHISTIDSYCSSVVKEFFYLLNIDRNLRLLDNGELAIIKNEALKLTLDSMYFKSEPDFFRLVEAFKDNKDDKKLQKNILRIHEFLRSHPFMNKWISKTNSMFTDIDNIRDSVWGKIIFDYSRDAAGYLIPLCESSLDCISNDEKLNEKLLPIFSYELDMAQKLSDTLKGGSWEDVSRLLSSISFPKFNAPRGYKDNPYKLKAEVNRKEYKSIIKELSQLFSYDTDTCNRDIAHLFVLSSQLLNCVSTFSNNYQMLKANKKAADYADLEHWTLQLLMNEDDMSLTDTARQISSRFDEILVDEYQDANEVQEYIFKSISNGSNLFFVGDVKQSIYGFRQAMPQLFLNRKNTSALYDEHKPSFPAKIILDKNFRSASGITNAVNYFFTKLMSESVGDICYDEYERLVCGATYNDESEPSVNISLLDLDAIGEEDPCVAEAKYIAQTIMKMIGEGYQIKNKDTYRNVRYDDFAVIMRNCKKHAHIYADVLCRSGVPAFCQKSTDSFLDSQEIRVVTCLLCVIDNPCLDIELLTVLMSPLFGFTADDIARVRTNSRKTSLYSSVLISADKGDTKCKHFLSELSYYRDICVTMSVSQLINTIYNRTSYENIVSALTGSRIAVNNLKLFREYAANYEQSTNSGLSGFVYYINRLIECENDLESAADLDAASKNAVKIMSIHNSKGLEFPVCFIANQARKFSTDKTESVLLHSKYGLAVKRFDKSRSAWYNTMPREALKLEIGRDEISEELRVLYVAMTRAKQKLYLLSSHKKLEKYLINISTKLNSGTDIPPFLVRKTTLLSDWIVMCAMLHPDCKALRDFCSADIKCDMQPGFSMSATIVSSLEIGPYCMDSDDTSDDITVEPDFKLVELLKERMSFEYDRASLLKLPSKLAASELSHKLSDNGFERVLDTPAFMNDQKLTPAQRGTALHAFMQYCDFNSARADLEQELTRLKNSGYITTAQAESIDRQKAFDFVNSDIITRCISSDTVYKEYRFTIKIDASLVDSSIDEKYRDEKILLQGAVDLAFVEDGKLVIVDYKTDNVKNAEDLYTMYHSQLELYRDAMTQCTDYDVKECLIYSLKHNKAIAI